MDPNAPSFVPTRSRSAGSNTTAAAAPPANAAVAGHGGAPPVVVVYGRQGEQQPPLGAMFGYTYTGFSSAAEHGGPDVQMAAFSPGMFRRQSPSNPMGYPYLPYFVPGGVARGNPMTGYPYRRPSLVRSGVPYQAVGMESFPYQAFPPGGVHPNPAIAGSFTTADQLAASYNNASNDAPAAALYDSSTSASTGHDELPADLDFLYEHPVPRPAHQWPPVHHPDWASSSNAAYIHGAGSSSTTAPTDGPWPGALFTIPPADHASSSATENGVSPHSSKESFVAGVLEGAMEPKKTFKNRLCCTWLNNGHCPLADGCKYAHGEDQQWTSPADEARKAEAQKNGRYKTRMCRYWVHYGSCTFGKNCPFAHGPRDSGQG